MLVALACMLLAALDQTVVAMALPRIAAELGQIELLAWSVTAYMLGCTAMMPVCGRLSDVHGRRRVLLVGLVLFAAASAACGAAGSLAALVVARGAQGLGAAILQAMALTTPADLAAPAERARYQALFPVVFLVASTVGPVVGGAVTDAMGWRWVFYLNLPIAALLAVAVARVMPDAAPGGRPRVSYAGAALLLVGMLGLLAPLAVDHATHGWRSPLVLGSLAVGAGSLVALRALERRAAEPIVPLPLLRDRTVAAACAAALLLNVASVCLWILLPLFLVDVLGTSAAGAGAAFVALAVGFVVGSVVGSAVAQRSGRSRAAMITGAAVAATGFALLAGLDAGTGVAAVSAILALTGLGFGLVVPLTNLAVQNAVPHRMVGAATGLRQLAVMLGQVVGAAAVGALIAATFPDPALRADLLREATAAAIARVYLVLLPLPILALLCLGLLPLDRVNRSSSVQG
jgi:EmrB/QacA subfamily drug resistance transporter